MKKYLALLLAVLMLAAVFTGCAQQGNDDRHTRRSHGYG